MWLNVTGLWRSKNNKDTLIGSMGANITIVIKPNDRKEKDNQPDFVLLLTEKNERGKDDGADQL